MHMTSTRQIRLFNGCAMVLAAAWAMQCSFCISMVWRASLCSILEESGRAVLCDVSEHPPAGHGEAGGHRQWRVTLSILRHLPVQPASGLALADCTRHRSYCKTLPGLRSGQRY